MSGLGLIANAWQIAYVTNDLDRAVHLLRNDYGAGEFLVLRQLPGALTDIALAWCGETMIELLYPLAASGDFYSDHIAGASGFVLRHHHMGMLVERREEMDDIRARHAKLGHAIPLEGENPGAIQYLYADCRPTLGHYLEYIRLEEEGRALFAAVPGSPLR